MATKPRELVIRAYQVGFGDCFLLSFRYPKDERHVLVDFGTTELPEAIQGGARKHLLAIANDVAKRCNGKLHAVVATHRHRDHIDGFATAPGGKGPGDVIRTCKPEVVIQPWTEHPRAGSDAKRAPSTAERAFAQRLVDMHHFARLALGEAERLRGLTPLSAALSFLGQNNIKNESAVKNLMTMGNRRIYAHAGSRLALGKVLPGVNVRVLGPPTLEQSAGIAKQRRTDRDEFWQLQQRFWGLQTRAGTAANGKRRLFRRAPVERDPIYARWLRRQLAEIRGESLFEIVRILDSAMNNTSLILLFEAGTKRLLFPGDAQIENWEYALSRKEWKPLLAGVHLYKVGHHGSLNATPKSLWKEFRHRRSRDAGHPLQSLVSTLEGKHGKVDSGTEVPRESLVRELRKETNYFSTQSLRSSLYGETRIALT